MNPLWRYTKPMNRSAIKLTYIAIFAMGFAGKAAAQFDDGVKALRATDYAAAMADWQKSAQSGDSRGDYGIGYLYQFGLGVAADDGQARSWYQKAAALNNADALYALGRMEEGGKAGPRDLAKALKDYRAAAADGLADAEFAVGRMILRGRVAGGDPKEALDSLNKAAAQNHPGAQFLLGEAYETGWGVHSDKIAAFVWYSRAKAGDKAWLHDTDLEFEPDVALAALKKTMSGDEIRAAIRDLKQAAPPVSQPAVAAPTEAKAGH